MPPVSEAELLAYNVALRRSHVMRQVFCGLLSCALLPAASVSDKPDNPFKLATFEAGGKARVGMVLGDRVLDLSGANTYVARQAALPAVQIPSEMRVLIEQANT